MDTAALLDALPDPVVVVDAGAVLRWANPAAEAAFGWRSDEHLGRAVDHLLHPDDRATALASLASVLDKPVGSLVDIRVRVASGEYRTFEVRGAAAAPLGFDGCVMAMRDVTDRYGWEIAAGDDDLHHAVLDRAAALTLLLDGDRRIRSATRALTAATGHDLESTLGTDVVDLVVAEERPAVAAELELVAAEGGARTFDATLVTKPGGRHVRMSLTAVGAVDDAAIGGIVLSGVDITSLDESRRRLRHLATHDALTGLPNRTLLLEHLQSLLAAPAGVHRSGVIFCDLDGFKDVNDRLGHAGGDTVLVQVARRLADAVRAGDVVGRLAGDEFVVVLPATTPAVLHEVCDRIDAAMEAPFDVPGAEEVSLSISTGWAIGTDGTSATDLFDRADRRMYGTKRERRDPSRPQPR